MDTVHAIVTEAGQHIGEVGPRARGGPPGGDGIHDRLRVRDQDAASVALMPLRIECMQCEQTTDNGIDVHHGLFAGARE